MDISDVNRLLAPYVYVAKSQKSAYKLDRMRRLMDALGNPQNNYPAIHVAGTSGKTSTCYYLANLLHAAGKKVGLTISPHITDARERVQINCQLMPEAVFAGKLTDFIKIVKGTGIEPTYFELLVAFAYWCFAKEAVDYAVVEVGLGGLLDGTNVIRRKDKVCVITDIGMDHLEILGDSLEKIAKQKAGIIHNGNQVFMYDQGEIITGVVSHTAKEKSAKLHIVKPADNIDLPVYQRRNFGLAASVVSSILGVTISAEQAKAARSIQVPGRFEKFKWKGRDFIIDGAHNPKELQVLFESIMQAYHVKKIVTIAAMSERDDQSVKEGMQIIAKNSDSCIVTKYYKSQDLPKKPVSANKLAAYAHAATVIKSIDPESALNKALGLDGDLIVVTGSLYLVSECRMLLGQRV